MNYNIQMLKCQYNQSVIKGGARVGYYKRIRELREDNDLTQKQIAEYLNMKQPQYNRYEQGLRDIPSDILIALAALYNTTSDYILGISDKK